MIFVKIIFWLWIFENFYDEVIYRDDSYLWSNEKIKIETEDLNFAMMIFWNFVDFRVSSDSLGVKYRIMQNYKLYEKSAYFENVAGNVNRIQVKFSGNFGINFISVYPGLSHLCWSIQNGFEKSLSFLINFINSRKKSKNFRNYAV